MKILSFDEKEGRIRLRVQSKNDLRLLAKLVLRKGDFVKSKTRRRVSIKRGGDVEKGELVPVVIEVIADEVKYDGERLRVSGRIREAPDFVKRSSFHTIEINENSTFEVKKERWPAYVLESIKRSEEKIRPLLICCVSRDSTTLALLRGSEISKKGTVERRDRDDEEGYHKEISSFLRREGCDIALCGPGFERENLLSFLKERERETYKKIICSEHVSDDGMKGIHEFIKKSMNKVVRKNRIRKESEMVEEFMKRVRMGYMVAYGKNDVERAVSYGAVETLLVSSRFIDELESIISKAESQGAKVEIISDDHEAGEQFSHFKVAAFLRFSV